MDVLAPTPLLDFRDPTIQDLIASRGWQGLPERQRIHAIYGFIRDEIPFGYNEDDALPASRILSDGYGQCNTKGVLFMALLRAVGVPCRFHAFTIHKALQRGAISGIWYRIAPKEIIHSWVEVYHDGAWMNLEGLILDRPYLRSVQAMFSDRKGGFCGYGIATDCFEAPAVEWSGGDTYIQKEGIEQDFGLFPDPDAFFRTHKQSLGFIKKVVFRHITRYSMNRRVERIRNRLGV